MIATLIQDLRYAVRTLRQRPGLTVVAALTLALGIGANTAIYGVVHTLLLRHLPVPEAKRLVSLSVSQPGLILMGREVPIGISYPDFLDYRDLKDVFSDAIAFNLNVVRCRVEDAPPERLILQIVSGNYFSMLGVEASPGRTFTREEGETMGAGNVMVLAPGFWQRRFAGDPEVMKRQMHLNGVPFSIVGVAPERFPGTGGPVLVDAYVPVTAWELLFPDGDGPSALENRSAIAFRSIAKLRPGVSLNEAAAAARVHAERLEQEYPESNKGVKAWVHPEPMARLEPSATVYLPPVAAVFMALVSLVLLIACANVANLLLAQATGRKKEIAIRAALGSGRLRILRQLLTESVLLALLGGVGGLLLAYWATRVLSSVRIASDFPIAIAVSLNWEVFLFAFLIACATGIVSGLVPGLMTAKVNLHEELKEGGRTSGTGGRHLLRNLLVVLQVAGSLVLLIAATLFVRSMQNFAHMDLGFQIENRLILSVDAGLAGYEEEQGKLFFRQLLDRVRALPGVRTATMAESVLIGMGSGGSKVFAEGRESRGEEQSLLILSNVVDTDYFPTIGTPILEGRAFDDNDTEDSRGVVIVNEVLAQQLWPDQSAIGRRLSVEGPEGPFLDVVGVAKLSTYNLPGEPPQPYLYLPLSQRYRAFRVLHVHTQGDPRALISTVRAEALALDPDMPIFDVRTMETHIREGKGAMLFQLGSGLSGAFGLIGLALACIGLYGVMAYWVGQRVQEMGVRMAMGATTGRILALVMRHGLLLAAVGLILGLGLAFLVTRLFANLLVDVSATDPATFVGVPLLLLAVAAVAALIPALRASRVDPIEALRYE